jgi:hypothetical protein
VARGGPELVEFSVTFDATLRAGVEGEVLEESRVCRLDLGLYKANKANHRGHGR